MTATSMPRHTAALDQIARIQRERQQLLEAALDTEVKLLATVQADYAAGRIEDTDLLNVYAAYRQVGHHGFSKRWDTIVTVPSRELKHAVKTPPNGPRRHMGRRFSAPGSPTCAPPASKPVTFVLYGSDGRPCYVGHTDNFRSRMRRLKGIPARTWRAYPHTDKAAARQLQRRLLDQYKPHLNESTGA